MLEELGISLREADEAAEPQRGWETWMKKLPEMECTVEFLRPLWARSHA